jgi:ubiquinone/menaquinone biosynthesis C-methylase UbiE
VRIRREAQIQDYVSDFYEEQRYQLPYARLYHDWLSQKILSSVVCKGRILDDGCGTGILSEALQEPGIELIGLDISRKMLMNASKRMKMLTMGDSECLPFTDSAFDLVIGRSLLHHLSDPAKGVREIHRVLRTNGEMVVVDTNRSLISALPRALAKRGEHFSDEHKNMSQSELLSIISRYFRIDNVYHFGFLAYPIAFPDIVKMGKCIPFAKSLTKVLIKIDELFARIPLIRTQSWGVMIKSTKPKAY